MKNNSIKKLMKKKNITYYKLGLLIGVTPQAATNWSRRGIPAKYAKKVAKALGVNVEQIME